MPPEKSAYALARYSRSSDSIRESIDWVRTHNSQQFLESYYFQYGHQSIADLGHTVLCFENISELAASEIIRVRRIICIPIKQREADSPLPEERP